MKGGEALSSSPRASLSCHISFSFSLLQTSGWKKDATILKNEGFAGLDTDGQILSFLRLLQEASKC